MVGERREGFNPTQNNKYVKLSATKPATRRMLFKANLFTISFLFKLVSSKTATNAT